MQTKKNIRAQLYKILLGLITCIVVIVFMYPLFWILVVSFKDPSGASIVEPFTFKDFSFKSYIQLFTDWDAFRVIANSVLICLPSTLIATILGSTTAYGLVRSETRHKDNIFFLILSFRFVAPVLIVIPLFTFYAFMGLIGTHIGLIIIYTVFSIPFIVWVMRSFYLDIPKDTIEAGLLDGLSEIGAFLKIATPQTISGLLTASALAFVFNWNEYLFSLMMGGVNTKAISYLVATFRGDNLLQWSLFAAAGTLMIIPTTILIVSIRKWLTRGLTFGLVK
jgi:multiple sugar transport system permease protein